MKPLLWVAVGLGALAALLFLTCQTGFLPAEKGALYEDSAGRFCLRISEDIQLIEGQTDCVHWGLRTPPIEIYLVCTDPGSLEEGIDSALRKAGQDPRQLIPTASGTLGSWSVRQYAATAESEVILAAQARGGCSYVLAALGDRASFSPTPPMRLMQLFESFRFTQAAGEPWQPSSFEEFEACVDKAAARSGGSISIAVSRDGEIAYTYTTGCAYPLNHIQANTMTVYPWFSITKLVTATAVMQLVESGRVGLDEPISRFVPEYRDVNVSVRQLLSHSSGLPERNVYDLIELPGESCLDIRAISEEYAASIERLMYEPGTRWCYNNYDYLVLGRLVEEVSGLAYTTYVQKNILDQLGMLNSGFHYSADLLRNAACPVLPRAQTDEFVSLLAKKTACGDPTRFIGASDDSWTHLRCFEILAPWGGLIGAVADAATFMAAHLSGGTWNGATILTPDSVRVMQTMQVTPSGEPLGFGLGWVIPDAEDEPIVEHAGGAGAGESMMRLYPQRGLGIVVMGNMSGYHPGTLITYLAALLSK